MTIPSRRTFIRNGILLCSNCWREANARDMTTSFSSDNFATIFDVLRNITLYLKSSFNIISTSISESSSASPRAREPYRITFSTRSPRAMVKSFRRTRSIRRNCFCSISIFYPFSNPPRCVRTKKLYFSSFWNEWRWRWLIKRAKEQSITQPQIRQISFTVLSTPENLDIHHHDHKHFI